MKRMTKAIVAIVILIALVYLVGIPEIPYFDNYQIRLSAGLDPHSFESGSNVSLSVTMTNLWFTTYLLKENFWVRGINLMGGPCSYTPLGFLVYQGNLTQSTLMSATPLNVSNPSVIVLFNCPMIRASPLNAFYRFNGFSSISYSTSFGGYWTPLPPYTGNQSSQTYVFNEFGPGVYTVLVKDAWGANVLLHFIVN
jgi:hypothetical protein